MALDSALGWNRDPWAEYYQDMYGLDWKNKINGTYGGSSNSVWSNADFTNPSNLLSNLGSGLNYMGNQSGTNADFYAKILGNYTDVYKSNQNDALARAQMDQQNKQYYDNLAWQKEELQKQLDQAKYDGDATRANQLEMQHNDITAKMEQLKYQMEQNRAEAEAERGWKTSERLGEQDYGAWSQQTNLQEAARQAELDRQYQENAAAQQYQRNRESQWANALYDTQQQKNGIYAGMADMITDEQKSAGLSELGKASSQYANWLAQGGIYSPEEIKRIEQAAYSDVANQTQANMQSYANSMASRGMSGSPAAARIMQQQGLTAAAQGRGSARADITQKQAQSRMDAASGYSNLQSQLAQLQARATQTNAQKAADSIVSPSQWWNPNSTGTTTSWASTGNNGQYTPNNNYTWR